MSWSPYVTGTVALSNGSAAVVGTGSGWALAGLGTQANLLIVNGVAALVDTVTDDTHLTLTKAWPGSTVSGAAYELVAFPQDGVTLTKEFRDFLVKLLGQGLMYYVTDAAPAAEVGEDGNFAVKISAGLWTFWVKTSGAWVLLGTPAGINWRGVWNAGANYLIGDAVSRLGSAYIAIAAGSNRAPETNAGFWQVLVSPGNRYDVAVFYPVRPADAESILDFEFTTTVTFLAGLAESKASSQVAALAASVFSLKKNGTPFGTLTFGIGSAVGVITSAGAATFNAGDILSVVTPTPRDTNLRGIRLTLTGYR